MSGFDWEQVAAAIGRTGSMYRQYMDGLVKRPVAPTVDRAMLRERFRGTLGEEGVGIDQVLDEIEELVLPYAMSTAHPRYVGLVNSSPLPAAPLADLIVSMLNNNGGAFHQSPPATTAEEEVVRLFADLLHCNSESTRGLLLPGGTFANQHGLLLARAKHFPQWRRQGPAAVQAPRLYTSTAVHFSVTRTAQVIGIGEDNVVAVDTIGRGAIDVADLRRRISTDREAGRQPFAVVATVGTTGTGAIDDVAAVAEVCREFSLWLHVDMCYGGAASLLPERAPHVAGVHLADSIAIDPHKWFFMPMTAGLALTKHSEVETAAFGLDVSYIPSGPEPEAFNRGLPTTRRSTGLTVWAALRAHGLETIRAAVRRNIEQMRSLETQLAAAGFRVLPGGELSIACARFEPEGMDPVRIDELQREISEGVIASGTAWFSITHHEGETWLRFNAVNLHTTDADIEQIATAVIRAAQEAA